MKIVLWLLSVMMFLCSSLVIAQATYVGSEKCKSCHRSIYNLWQETLHNKSQQVLTDENDTMVVDWKDSFKLKAGKIPEVTVKLSETKEHLHQATLVDAKDPAKEVTYDVARTYGGWGWKQRYQTKIGNNYFILPFQWNQATSKWAAYNLQNWYKEDGSLKTPPAEKSFEMNCAGCHNTGLALKKADHGYESTFVELNIGCERCHGAGSKHVKAPKTEGTIINPRKLGKLEYERGIEVCGQCHSRGMSVPNGTFEFPWNDQENKPYQIGEPLENYYKLKPGVWSDSEGHSKQHHQQWIDFQRSTHFTAKVFCFDCHNPHGGADRSQLLKSENDNTLCQFCHKIEPKFATPARIREHTKHNYAPETRGTSRCSSCHLVKTATSSGDVKDIHSHDFKIIKPHVSLEMFKKDPQAVMGNSCNRCHQSWGNDLAGFEAGVKAYESLFGKK